MRFKKRQTCLLTGTNPVSRLQRCVFSDLLEAHQELDYLIKHQRALLLSALCSFILCTERAGQFYLKYSGLMV